MFIVLFICLFILILIYIYMFIHFFPLLIVFVYTMSEFPHSLRRTRGSLAHCGPPLTPNPKPQTLDKPLTLRFRV